MRIRGSSSLQHLQSKGTRGPEHSARDPKCSAIVTEYSAQEYSARDPEYSALEPQYPARARNIQVTGIFGSCPGILRQKPSLYVHYLTITVFWCTHR
eukprot:625216-Amorphochlora_amoeboformis.AAC.1